MSKEYKAHKAIPMSPFIWYYLLRAVLAKKKYEAIAGTDETYNEAADALYDKFDYWETKSKRKHGRSSRHHCLHSRHSNSRSSHVGHFGPFRYNHYPLRDRNNDPMYIILPWGSQSHHAIDIVFKWNLYCFAINLKYRKEKKEQVELNKQIFPNGAPTATG